MLYLQHGINVADIKKLKTAGICTIRGIMTKKSGIQFLMNVFSQKVFRWSQRRSCVLLKVYLKWKWKRWRKRYWKSADPAQASAPRCSIVSTGGTSSGCPRDPWSLTSCLAEAWSRWRSRRCSESSGQERLNYRTRSASQPSYQVAGKWKLLRFILIFEGENGYSGGKVIYIDTENTFRPDRLRCASTYKTLMSGKLPYLAGQSQIATTWTKRPCWTTFSTAAPTPANSRWNFSTSFALSFMRSRASSNCL